jgi:hypothetical protein
VLRDAHQDGHLVCIRPVLAQRQQQQRRDEVQPGPVVLRLLDLFGRQNLKKEINFHLSAIESGMSTFRVGPRLTGGSPVAACLMQQLMISMKESLLAVVERLLVQTRLLEQQVAHALPVLDHVV